MDNLFEQLTQITKANAYDIIAPHTAEVKEQNITFRKALTEVVNTIVAATANPAEIINNPAELIGKIASICQETLSKNRPL